MIYKASMGVLYKLPVLEKRKEAADFGGGKTVWLR
jgi:hypothetical protein